MTPTKPIWPAWYRAEPKQPRPMINVTIKAAQVLGVPVDDIRSKGSTRSISRVRWAIAHVMRDSFKKSYPEIGKDLNRHHSTMVYAVQQSRELVKTDPEHANMVDALVMAL